MSKYQTTILKALRRRPLTTAQIIERYRILRPASVIEYLREQGHHIVTMRRGNARMAVYVLVERCE